MELKDKKSKNINSLKRLMQFLTPYKWNAITVLIALSITSFSLLIFGYVLKIIVDIGFQEQTYNELIRGFIFLFIISFIFSAAVYVRSSSIYILCEKIELDIRNKVFNHIINMPIGFFEIQKSSDVIARLTVDTAVINSIIANILSFFIRNSIMMFGGIICLIYISLKLTLFVFSVIPLIVITIITCSKKIKLYSSLTQESISDVGAKIEEVINGIRTVKAFNAEQHESSKFTNLVGKTFDISSKRYKFRSILSTIIIFSVLISILLILWIGSYDIINHKMTSGDLSSFIFYAIMVASSMTGIGDVIGELYRANASAERIFALLDYQTEGQNDVVDETSPMIDCKTSKDNIIVFDNVSFAYPSNPNAQILKNISFTIRAGENIAIVGSSGAGKSTIINLLLGFYNISNGEIYINNKNIQKMSLHDIRETFTLVSQEPYIFADTAKNNIKYGNLLAQDEEIISVSKSAEIFEYFDSLPEGLNTYLGEKGIRLSGGQKQRVAIARAMLKNSSILLFDEATSSLDQFNEKQVQEAIEKLRKQRTCITISHRMSAIMNADRILLLNNGQIEEEGTYNELLAKSPLFRKLSSSFMNH